MRALRADGVAVHGRPVAVSVNVWSAVWTFATDAGRFWLKAGRPGDGGVESFLAPLLPDLVVAPVTAEPTRGWLLTRDAGPTMDAELSAGAGFDVERVCRLVGDYAALQRGTLDRRSVIGVGEEGEPHPAPVQRGPAVPRAATAVAWQFSGPDHERRERAALRIIAVSFYALAAYVAVESVRALLGDDRAGHSTVGLVLAALSLAVMPVLSAAQRRAGRELGSASAVADSKQTLLCTYLSAVLLVGLAVNSVFGWWWADPVAALVIAAVAVTEGREAWRGDTCCTG
jgi:hypothetical protein